MTAHITDISVARYVRTVRKTSENKEKKKSNDVKKYTECKLLLLKYKRNKEWSLPHFMPIHSRIFYLDVTWKHLSSVCHCKTLSSSSKNRTQRVFFPTYWQLGKPACCSWAVSFTLGVKHKRPTECLQTCALQWTSPGRQNPAQGGFSFHNTSLFFSSSFKRS